MGTALSTVGDSLVQSAEIRSTNMLRMHQMTLDARKLETETQRAIDAQRHEQVMASCRHQTLLLAIQLERLKQKSSRKKKKKSKRDDTDSSSSSSDSEE